MPTHEVDIAVKKALPIMGDSSSRESDDDNFENKTLQAINYSNSKDTLSLIQFFDSDNDEQEKKKKENITALMTNFDSDRDDEEQSEVHFLDIKSKINTYSKKIL